MPSTSKSNRRKPKAKFVPKPKQQWRVKEPKRNWLELPSDVMANILYRVGVYDILENAQKACTTWRKICKDPAMWRVIYMHAGDRWARRPLQKMCKHAVDLSQGQLVDITIKDFANRELLKYIADRSSQLRRLDVSCCYGDLFNGYDFLKKIPLLEELSLYRTVISKGDIEIAGHCCPMLRTLKIKRDSYEFTDEDSDEEESVMTRNEIAIAVGKNFPELRHLELIGNSMSNVGLQAILDGCRHLESLDLRQCLGIDLEGDLMKRCSEKIKCLKLPNDSLEGCQFGARWDLPEDFVSGVSDDECYDEYFDYDDYTDPFHPNYMNNYSFGVFDSDDDSTGIEDVNDMLAFMAFFG